MVAPYRALPADWVLGGDHDYWEGADIHWDTPCILGRGGIGRISGVGHLTAWRLGSMRGKSEEPFGGRVSVYVRGRRAHCRVVPELGDRGYTRCRHLVLR